MSTTSQTTRRHLKPGQAQIVAISGGFELRYMNEGAWTLGERRYGREADAREFCADRGLRVS